MDELRAFVSPITSHFPAYVLFVVSKRLFLLVAHGVADRTLPVVLSSKCKCSLRWGISVIRNSIPNGDQKQAGADQRQAFPPAISIPKGGGAIRGIDEKLSVNPATGAGALRVPIFTTPGRSNFHPQLALAYDSGAGNGPFGFGWSLSQSRHHPQHRNRLPASCSHPIVIGTVDPVCQPHTFL